MPSRLTLRYDLLGLPACSLDACAHVLGTVQFDLSARGTSELHRLSSAIVLTRYFGTTFGSLTCQSTSQTGTVGKWPRLCAFAASTQSNRIHPMHSSTARPSRVPYPSVGPGNVLPGTQMEAARNPFSRTRRQTCRAAGADMRRAARLMKGQHGPGQCSASISFLVRGLRRQHMGSMVRCCAHDGAETPTKCTFCTTSHACRQYCAQPVQI